MTIAVCKGSKLYLNLQLHDLGITPVQINPLPAPPQVNPKRVFVLLKNDSGALVKPAIELTDLGDGYFFENLEVMPDFPFMTAHFYVKESSTNPSDGFNELSLSVDHGIEQEIYVTEIPEFLKDRLDGKISAISNAPVDLEGVIGTSVELIGIIEDQC